MAGELTLGMGANGLRFGQPMAMQTGLAGMGYMPDLTQLDLSSIGSGTGGRAPNGLFGIEGLGANMDTLRLGLGGLGTLGNLWGAFQAQGLAREQLDFAKKMGNANLTNQVQSYNTALEDRARARGAMEGQSPQQVEDYVTRNRLSR